MAQFFPARTNCRFDTPGDPESNSLLVLFDDAQSIYRSKRGKAAWISASPVGIQAQDRTTILRLDYCNTEEVLSVAQTFAVELLTARDAAKDGVPIVAHKAQAEGRVPRAATLLVRLAGIQLYRRAYARRARSGPRVG
ncbi:hypothetical protein SAMN04487857_11956 [Pseudomonas sp. ok272]|uniref:hypothetical protein n=1 Tax=unclassified Pseudomonas TaxID=196821 RepID=UPI0008C0538C|nr:MULTISPECIES: hypothetical protein [unclassified Pseudomonas]SEN50528.1 hypothetical protein SAMN04487857_11956 [Pseudomonas sp. ok272]SFN29515.1 hypothetical protein SAMN04487858_11810 [Pseudomonas sp. ok602]